jgi:hypothetical protein
MPYIEPELRRALDEGWRGPETVGELTYVLYRTILTYVDYPVRFSNDAEVIAALEYAKFEFMRRHTEPHEDTRRRQNGDVYPHTRSHS